jgi:hypothetical protein
MKSNRLFLIAPIFNWIVAGPMLLAYPLVASLPGLHRPPKVFYHIVLSFTCAVLTRSSGLRGSAPARCFGVRFVV